MDDDDGVSTVVDSRSARAFTAEVRDAVRRLEGVAERTPLQRNDRLSAATRADVPGGIVRMSPAPSGNSAGQHDRAERRLPGSPTR